MRTITFAIKKGGTGKTTSTINLAGALAKLKQKVLVVDMEAQANSSYVFLNNRISDLSIFDLLMDQKKKIKTEDVIQPTQVPNIDILPSHSQKMDGAERSFVGMVGEQLLLRNRLQELDPSRYDFALIDTTPTKGILTINALAAADEVIVPVDPGIFAIQGILDLYEIVEQVRNYLDRPDLKITGFLLTQVQNTNVSKDVQTILETSFQEPVLKSKIPKNTKINEAHSRHITIFQHSPKCSAAVGYLSLAKEVTEYGKKK